MSIANKLDEFFKSTNQRVFIEVEGKPTTINNFLIEYNSKYSPIINKNDDGIIVLQEDANKWGKEFRLYFEDREGIPAGIHVTLTSDYRSNFNYRINNKNLILELFELGYRIGEN